MWLIYLTTSLDTQKFVDILVNCVLFGRQFDNLGSVQLRGKVSSESASISLVHDIMPSQLWCLCLVGFPELLENSFLVFELAKMMCPSRARLFCIVRCMAPSVTYSASFSVSTSPHCFNKCHHFDWSRVLYILGMNASNQQRPFKVLFEVFSGRYNLLGAHNLRWKTSLVLSGLHCGGMLLLGLLLLLIYIVIGHDIIVWRVLVYLICLEISY